MLQKIIYLIIEEAISKKEQNVTCSIHELVSDIVAITSRLTSHITKIRDIECSDQEKQLFIDYLLQHPF